jgi:hypothetical protein
MGYGGTILIPRFVKFLANCLQDQKHKFRLLNAICLILNIFSLIGWRGFIDFRLLSNNFHQNPFIDRTHNARSWMNGHDFHIRRSMYSLRLWKSSNSKLFRNFVHTGLGWHKKDSTLYLPFHRDLKELRNNTWYLKSKFLLGYGKGKVVSVLTEAPLHEDTLV